MHSCNPNKRPLSTCLLAAFLLTLCWLYTGQALTTQAPLTTPQQREREALLTQRILELVQSRHLRHLALDDATSEVVFEHFIARLDPGKLYLTQTDLDRLRAFADKVDDQLRVGQLDLAHMASAMRRQRAAMIAEWTAEQLKTPFDFNIDESLETSGKKRSFCANETLLRERWRRVLKSEVLLMMTRARQADNTKPDANSEQSPDDNAQTDAQLEATAREKLSRRLRARFKRIAQENRQDDLDRFLNAFLMVYDPHTTYLSPFAKQQSDIRIQGSFEGIGASLRIEDGSIKVKRVIPGSASWRQGKLKSEDIIVAVAQDQNEPVDVVDMPLREVVMLIRGPKGTVVNLTVRKPDGQLQVIPITRDVVQLEATFAKAAVLQHNQVAGRFAYIDLPRFYGRTGRRSNTTVKRRTATDLRLALQKLNGAGVRGLVLDLRGNTGGLLSEAVQATGLFITEGPVLQMRNTDDKQWAQGDRDKRIFYQGPMVILVDRFSASASEILASALQDYGRAVIVGSATSGKGTVQKFYRLDRASDVNRDQQAEEASLGTLKLTFLQYYRIKGDSIQLHGVDPDILLPDPAAHQQTFERLRTHAITEHAIAAVPFTVWPHPWQLQELRVHSLARLANHAGFERVKARTAFLTQQLDDTVISLNQNTWMQQRQEAEATLSTYKLDETVRFAVQPLEYIDVSITPAAARAENAAAWAKDLHSDIWIEEALYILNDMAP